MLPPDRQQDKLVRATDLDALACRFSANKKGYFDPCDAHVDILLQSYERYLQYCSGYTNLSSGRAVRSVLNERKLPLINRGTYLRTVSINSILERFAEEFDHCQIVSLGSGSDTRAFRMLQKFPNLRYHEIDYPESIKIKKLAIISSQELKNIVNCSEIEPAIKSREEFEMFESDFSSDHFSLSGYDLRNIREAADVKQCFSKIDFSLPTIILSECVLCYLSLEENENIINAFRESFEGFMSILIYEPMSLSDSFGNTMSKNLSFRGLRLPIFDVLPNLESRKAFLEKKCNFPIVKLTNMSVVGGYSGTNSKNSWIEFSELSRVNRLELIDEIEEIKLLLEHYCLCYAQKTCEGHSLKGLQNLTWNSL